MKALQKWSEDPQSSLLEQLVHLLLQVGATELDHRLVLMQLLDDGISVYVHVFKTITLNWRNILLSFHSESLWVTAEKFVFAGIYTP